MRCLHYIASIPFFQRRSVFGLAFFCGRGRQAAGRRLPEQMAGTSNRLRRQKQGREQVTSRGGRWPASFGHREKRGGWVVPKYVPIRPVFEGCAEIAAYKSETVCDYRGADFAITQFGPDGTYRSISRSGRTRQGRRCP